MKKGAKGQRDKGAKVVNMSCEGEIQCPICYASFTVPYGQAYTAGVMDCQLCHKKIEIDTDTAEIGNAIINGRAVFNRTIKDVDVIKRVQWHLDVPVCRILAGVKIHIATLGLKERFWLFYQLGGESADELVNILWQLIRLQKKHKRSLKAA